MDESLNTFNTLSSTIAVEFNYKVYFTKSVFDETNPALINYFQSKTVAKLVFFIDSGVAQHHQNLIYDIQKYCSKHSKIELLIEPQIMPGGEEIKNNQSLLEEIYKTIERAKACRHSYIIAIGGGAFLDALGFAAATAHRGLRHIRIPTTVLSQNDSGVGIKNSINHYQKKNFLGSFQPPDAVINDAHFLTSLSQRDWRSGIAEAIKVSLIKDVQFFNWIYEHSHALLERDLPTMQELIYRCAQHHMDHIQHSGDPFEWGSSRPLDFGHWSAHKLEQLTSFELRHGEAVAIGIALDCCYSYKLGKLPESTLNQILTLFHTLGFKIFHPDLLRHLDEPDHPRSIQRGLNEFREHLGGTLTILLLESIASPFETSHLDSNILKTSLKYLEAKAKLS